MKTFTIDRSKWRCGDYEETSHGRGDTSLLNEFGYMCCLGMIGKQCGLSDEQMFNMDTPGDVDNPTEEYGYLFKSGQPKDAGDFAITKLARDAMNINDSSFSRKEREVALKSRFKKENIAIKFINEYEETA